MAIDRETIEQLATEKHGYEQIGRWLNHRFVDDREDVMQEALLGMLKRSDAKQVNDPKAFFRGTLRLTAIGHRGRAMDRANYCELGEWHAVVRPDHEPETMCREREIRDAQEQIEQLLRKVRLRHRIVFWEWRKRGYRCKTKAQSCALTRMVAALADAAGVTRHRNGHYSAEETE